MHRPLRPMLNLLPLVLLTGCAGDKPQILTVTAVTPATVVPASIPGGATDPTIVLTGTQFTNDLKVVLGTATVPTTITSSTTMQATVPSSLRVQGAVLPVGLLQNDGIQGVATLATGFSVTVMQPRR